MSVEEWKDRVLIPTNWTVKKIGDIGEVIGGGTPSTKNPDYYGGNISWITPKDLANHSSKYIFQGERSITNEGLQNSSAKILPKGTVLFSSRAPIGYVAIAGKELATNQGFKSIICNELVENEFLYYALNYYKDAIEQIASGSTFSEISGSSLKNFQIKLPPLEEQKAISKILSTIDDKIELNNQINQDLEEMAQAIFRSWFVDFEPFQDGEFVESELGRIPKGWRVERLGDVAHISSGKRPKDKKTESIGKYSVPVIGASKVMGYVNKPLYEEPILVIGRVGTHGVVQRVYGKSWPSDNTLVIKTIYHGFVYHILKQIDYKALNRGSTQPLITQRDLSNKKIVLPSEKVLCDFEDVIKKFTVHYNQNQLQNQDLIQLRDTLLPKLISGELRIPTEEGVESL